MSKRFDYVKYDENATKVSEVFKVMYSSVDDLINELEVTPSAGREKALAITKLEESFMWVGKMLRNNQIAVNGNAEHLPERNNS